MTTHSTAQQHGTTRQCITLLMKLVLSFAALLLFLAS